MTVANRINSIRKKLSSATASVANDIAELRRQITEKQKELGHAQRAPLPLNEIEARAQELVEREAAYWLRESGSSLIRGDRALAQLEGDARVPWYSSHGLPWGAICAAEPERAVALLTSLVKRLDYTPGPAAAERPGIIARLEAELLELETAEENIIDEAKEAGVMIDHRPDVTQRREQEKRQHELEEQKIANRKARQEELDARYASQPRAGRSQYLAREKSS